MAGLEIVVSAAIDMLRPIGKRDGRVEMLPTLQAIALRPAGRAVREIACLSARDSIFCSMIVGCGATDFMMRCIALVVCWMLEIYHIGVRVGPPPVGRVIEYGTVY